MSALLTTDPDCHYGDHTYHGGGICVRCGKRLRCFCGAFVTEDGIDAHMGRCRAFWNADGSPRAVSDTSEEAK